MKKSTLYLKYWFIFTLTNLLILTSTIAQNNIWSLPPNYYDVLNGISTPLPTQPGSNGNGLNYHPSNGNTISEFSHNAMQDKDGNLLFFVVDGVIYDNEGYYIAQMHKDYVGYMTGFTETVIVPVPGNCQQYYIIGTISVNTGNGHLSSRIYYAKLDFSFDNYLTGRKGILVDPIFPSPLGMPGNQAWDDQNNLFPLSDSIPNYSSAGNPESKSALAVSNLRADSTRLLFAVGEMDIYRFTISSTEITYDNYSFRANNATIPPLAEGHNRSEMELIETTTGYRIAFSYPSQYTPYNGIILFVGELNNNGNLISYNIKLLPQDIPYNSGLQANIKGLEFSPNGEYLYITHDPITLAPYNFPFKIYEVSTNNFIALTNSTMQSEIPAFKNSQIELGKDGKLYLANETSLATIGNSDNPTNGLAWNSSAHTINYNLSQLGYATNSERLKLYILPDQIEGMDYTAHFTANTECCVLFNTYTTGTDNANHEQYGTQTWNTTNPFGTTTITVKDELIIKAGANITANNLRFEFAPKAKLTIEQGAAFTANNCMLTVNTECGNDVMWNGVDVLGVDSGPQTGAGKLVLNGSTIEHSYLGAHNFKTRLDANNDIKEDYGYRGGFILAGNSTFRNNHRSTVFYDYQNVNGAGNAIDEKSRFTNCTFVTDAPLNIPSYTAGVIMAHLYGVQGVNFYGCDFKNIANYSIIPYQDRGIGIVANNSLLTVTSICLSIGCANEDKGNFVDLFKGIEANSSLSSARTTHVSKTNFINNWRGIRLIANNLASIKDNYFDVGVSYNGNVSYGLNLVSSNKYKVENNTFNTTHNGYLGVGINGSGGANNNEIYRNTFNNLRVGSQAQNTNGSLGANGGLGLEFRCNTYTNTKDVDILVSSGIIKPTHGQCVDLKSPSNNQFSYTATAGDFWQNTGVEHVTYQFSQPNGYKLEPRDFPSGTATHYNDTNTFPTYCSSVFNPATSCPSRGKKPIVDLGSSLAAFKQTVGELKSTIDAGSTADLLTAISTQSAGNIKNTLIAASPYLSDEVLLAYMQANAPNGHLKQVLLANSPLSKEVQEALHQTNLPKGIKNQLNNVQEGLSARDELGIETAYYENEVTKTKNDIIRYYLFEEGIEERMKQIISFLEQENCPKDKCIKTCIYTANKEYTKAQQELAILAQNAENSDFCKLYDKMIELEQSSSIEEELKNNSTIQTSIIEVAELTTEKQEVAIARNLLLRAELTSYVDEIEPFIPSGAGARLINQEKNETSNLELETSNRISVYPNPTSNEVNIAHKLNVENGKIIFEVYNMMGLMVINEVLSSTNNTIKVNNLKSGVYFYNITQNNTTIKTDKLMVR
ncbi:MAG: T9SS type A sorting domain-containing protein [Flavobacteriales bacterium]|nr:T9SS type A sorting domain-containing protein [Flavobacteriales bacterium]MCB9362987.1 T9SS type A sorting domain-containing protein [Flavobacteriales bacterium]